MHQSNPLIIGLLSVVFLCGIFMLAGAGMFGCARSIDQNDDSRAPNAVTEGDMAEFFTAQVSFEEFLDSVKQQEPDPQKFEFVGQIKFRSEEEYTRDLEEYEKSLSRLEEKEFNTLAAEAERQASREDDLVIAVSADGRVYQERPGTRKHRPSRKKAQSRTPNLGIKAPREPDRPYKESSSLNDLDSHLHLTHILGGDGRQLRTSSNYPWRAVGVALRTPGAVEVRCSGAMISHRLVLTAAHCVNLTSDNSVIVSRVAPAARGEGFSGNQSPFGNRFIEWYFWPKGCSGKPKLSKVRYDYAVLRLRDINASPGHVFLAIIR